MRAVIPCRYLVVWDGFEIGAPWRYMTDAELRGFLLQRIAEGYAFPLNPKWILCDAGWYEVYAAMAEHPLAQQAMDAWFPNHSGLRQLLEATHTQYPDGFVRVREEGAAEDGADVELDMARGELALRRYKCFRSAKIKLRAVLIICALGREATARREAAEREAAGREAAAEHGQPAPAAQEEDKVSSAPAPGSGIARALADLNDWFSNRSQPQIAEV